MQREQWGTRAGFLLAAIGSAIGLGNIWRFPYVAYSNGGGAFFLPYIVALLSAGIPILILEYTLGHKYRGSAPLAYFRVGSQKRSEWIGWWQIAISFVITTYYAVIIAWAMVYTGLAFTEGWGTDPEGFLFNDFLMIGEPGEIGGLNLKVLFPLLLVWAITLGFLIRGVRKGIELANRIFIPVLVLMFLIIVIRALMLEGASLGLNALFTPQWDQVLNAKVWVAAYGQIFFSLSIGMAIMVAYASYLPKNSDLTNNAFIAGLSNSSFELLAGIGVFAAIGFMALSANVAIEDATAGGVGLAFVVFPIILNEMPGINWIFGTLFFLSLVVAGISSLISLVEATTSGVMDKFNLSRKKTIAIVGSLSALVSLLYATNGGLYFLDIVDNYINAFGVALAGLVEIIIVAWFLRKLPELQTHADTHSDLKLNVGWRIALTVITPLLLGFMLIQSFIEHIKVPYEGYSQSLLLGAGWLVAALALVAGILLTIPKWRNNAKQTD